MNSYIDIQMLEAAEVDENLIMNKVFSKLHLRLVEVGYGKVGVSFPNADHTLGNCLRIHGSGDDLQALMNRSWTSGLEDYTKISTIRPAPLECMHRVVRRVQVKSNLKRLYRRSVRKGWLSEEEASARLIDKKRQLSRCPYLYMRSLSTGESFRLLVEQGEPMPSAKEGAFSAYGLSLGGTVPWF